ncbi:ATP-binding protein [Sphingorhabdus arenilitoris]|uniref:histidine kinase n=1 Tax=Sphingorhabdus arenilitoris TaxID=1490041 RepID=A0ABV8RC97_9SPHN
MKRLLSSFWPKSLYGQILFVAALALLAAQAINAAMLLNAARGRSNAEAATLLVGRVANQAERNAERGRDWTRQRQGRRRNPAVMINVNDSRLQLPQFTVRDDFTERAAEFFAQGDNSLTEVQISSGPISALPEALTRGLMQSRFVQRQRRSGRDMPQDAMLLTAKTGNGQWISAAVFVRPRDPGSIFVLLLQTLTLYAAVLIPLALVTRRIVKPLERLTERVGRVGLAGEDAPLHSEGPSDIRNLVDSFNIMQSRVSTLLGEKDVMLGAIGHDLKTPLAALRVRVESVEDDAERGKMIAAIDEMVTILDDILTLARLGKSGEEKQQTDLGALVDAIADEFAASGADVRMVQPEQRILAHIRPVLLRRAIRNLIGNAVKHGGNAEISVVQDAGRIAVHIDDTGRGIPPEQMDDMFQPFIRMDSSRNRGTGGSGLGLTIARAIASAHGGEVKLINRAEGGLRATMILPAG